MPRHLAHASALTVILLAGSALTFVGCEEKTEPTAPAAGATSTTGAAKPHDHAHDHADHDHDHDHDHDDADHHHDHDEHDHADEPEPAAGASEAAAHRPLEAELKAKSAEFAATMPPEATALHEGGIKQVAESGVLDTAKVVGDRAPDFTLSGPARQDVTLSKLLESGPVVLTWYRGGWCPYCNLTLRTYQEHLDEFGRRGAQLVALAPETSSHMESTVQQGGLEFAVLHDEGNKVAEQYGIVFTLPPEVAEAYEEGLGLSDYNGDDSARLPLTATYVIGQDGVIHWAFVSADYRQRAEPADIIEALDKLKN